jgi:hypothetical protein
MRAILTFFEKDAGQIDENVFASYTGDGKHSLVLALTPHNLAIDVSWEFALELFLQNEEHLPETVIYDETLEHVLKFSDLTGGDRSCEIRKFVRFVKDIGCNLVDREVGDLVAEERVQLRNILEDGHNFRHERADVLAIFVVGLRNEVVYLNDGDRVLVEERCLHGT